MPFGPSVVFTRSEMAMAPTKEARRAISPFSSVAPWFRMPLGSIATDYGEEQKLFSGSEEHAGSEFFQKSLFPDDLRKFRFTYSALEPRNCFSWD